MCSCKVLDRIGIEMQVFLTPLVPVYEMFVLQKPTLSLYFKATLQLHNSPGNWAWELFKPSKEAARLLVCIKKLESCGFSFFVDDVISGVGLSPKPLKLSIGWLFQRFDEVQITSSTNDN